MRDNIPQFEFTLSAILALHNGGIEPKIEFKVTGSVGHFIDGVRFLIDPKLMQFVTADEIEILKKAVNANDPRNLFTIFGNRIIQASAVASTNMHTPEGFALHNLALFASREEAEAALDLAKKIFARKNGYQYEAPVKIQMIKDHPDALPPRTAYNGTSAAFDLASVETIEIPAFTDAVVPVGLRLSIDESQPYYMTVHMRSSFGFKKGIQNHIGIIDAGYAGDFGVKVFNRTAFPLTITKGEYFAQVLVHKKPQIEFVELNNEQWKEYETKQQRGLGGFGSSGK